MKLKLLSLAATIVAASIIIACSSNGVSSTDVINFNNGPNSFKGTITGTMLDDTPYSFPFNYNVSGNDSDNAWSGSESWIEYSDGGTYDGDTILWFEQYFFFDRNGTVDWGDDQSPSGRYVYLELYIDIAKMKVMPNDYNTTYPYLEGMWQKILSNGSRFVYACDFRSSIASGTLDVTNLKYDNGSQILSGKVTMSLPDNHSQYNWYENYNATLMTGDFKVYMPKELFQVTNKGTDDQGNVYRKKKHR